MSKGREVSGYVIDDVVFSNALVIPSNAPEIEVELRFKYNADTANSHARSWMGYEFQIYSFIEERWSNHCQGRIRIEYDVRKHEEVMVNGTTTTNPDSRMGNLDQDSISPVKRVASTFIYEEVLRKVGYGYVLDFSHTRMFNYVYLRSAQEPAPLPLAL
jgi:hypothetical protein